MVAPLDVLGAIEYQPGGIVSRQLLKKPAGNVTLFAFDEGEELSEHTTAFDAWVHLLEGHAAITVGGTVHEVIGGQALLLPAQVPHAVKAVRRFKMTLTMIRG